MIISVISGKGSPGATATALGMTLCWPRPVLLVEADPAGGSMVFSYAGGADVGGRNLTGVRVAARRSGMAEAIWANVVTLEESRWLLPGVDQARQAEALDYAAVASALAGLGVDVLVDAGRIPAPVRHDALWAAADMVIVAMRSTLPAVHAAQTAAAAARATIGAAGPPLRSVIVGAGRPYSERDIRVAMADVAPVVGVLAWDPTAAGALVDALPAPRSFTSSPLMRTAARLAKSIAGQVEPDTAVADLVSADRAETGHTESGHTESGHTESGHAERGQPTATATVSGLAGDTGVAPTHRAAPATNDRHSSRAPAAAAEKVGGSS